MTYISLKEFTFLVKFEVSLGLLYTFVNKSKGRIIKVLHIYTELVKRKFRSKLISSHLIMKEEENPLECNVSDVSMYVVSMYDTEIKPGNTTLPDTKMLHGCNKCDRHYATKAALEEHILKLHCNMCKKAFATMSELKQHILTHTGEKLHACDFCGRTFSHKSCLQKHLLTHTGEKPHSCDICNRAFSLQRNLKRHLLTHTGEKPYVCEICQKTFSLQRNLKRHLYTHTGEITPTHQAMHFPQNATSEGTSSCTQERNYMPGIIVINNFRQKATSEPTSLLKTQAHHILSEDTSTPHP